MQKDPPKNLDQESTTN